MSKYFKPYKKINLTVAEMQEMMELKRRITEEFGTLTCDLEMLYKLWSDFSDTEYSAQFMQINPDTIRRFVDWLEELDDD